MTRNGKSALRMGIVGACATAVFVTGYPLDAHADPDAVAEAKERVEKLEMEAAALDQEALAAQEKLDAAKERLSTQQEDVTAQEEKVAAMKQQVGRVAVAQYQTRNVDTTTQLMLESDHENFLSSYATIEQVNNNQNDVLQAYQTEQANLNDMRRSAETDVKTIDEQTDAVNKAREESAKKVEEAQNELDRLTEEERQRLAELQRQEDEAARAAAEAADDTQGSADSASTGDTGSDRGGSAGSGGGSPVSVPPGSSKGQAALAFAKAQIGKPYSYGGTGPGSYDCSGLTGAAWSSVGVSIPRTSQAQYSAGVPVSKGDLQPGDLVFYYGGISHVGIYAGNGQIVHASRPGKPVGYAPLDSMPYQGARRVG